MIELTAQWHGGVPEGTNQDWDGRAKKKQDVLGMLYIQYITSFSKEP